MAMHVTVHACLKYKHIYTIDLCMKPVPPEDFPIRSGDTRPGSLVEDYVKAEKH